MNRKVDSKHEVDWRDGVDDIYDDLYYTYLNTNNVFIKQPEILERSKHITKKIFNNFFCILEKAKNLSLYNCNFYISWNIFKLGNVNEKYQQIKCMLFRL